MLFLDRQTAGKKLADKLIGYRGMDTVVLALPRGGIILGKEVAERLGAPLGLIQVRKLGHPQYEEYAIGAIAEGEAAVLDPYAIHGIDQSWLREAQDKARKVIARRRKLYYGGGFVPPEIEGKVAILVDDGIATGLTMRAAALAAISQGAEQVIVAVPVAAADSASEIKEIADNVILLDDPENFLGVVGAHYQKFDQVSDEEVVAALREASHGIRKNICSSAAAA